LMGDEMGGEGDMDGDEMGGEGDMDGDEFGDEMGLDDTAADLPCPDCNPEGEMEEGEPECETCGGEGYVTDDQMEMPEEPGSIDAGMADGGMGEEGMGGPAGEMMDLMSKMNSYCAKYMPAMMQAQMSAQMGSQMASHSKKFMDKDADEADDGDKKESGFEKFRKAKGKSKGKDKGENPFASKGKDKGEGKKCCEKPDCEDPDCCKEDVDFMNSLTDGARGTIHQKWSSTGLKEDALLAPVVPPQEEAPQDQAGDVGFAPQGRVGGIGNGYSMSDFSEIPTLGESHNYNTFENFIKSKK